MFSVLCLWPPKSIIYLFILSRIISDAQQYFVLRSTKVNYFSIGFLCFLFAIFFVVPASNIEIRHDKYTNNAQTNC